MHVFTNGNTEIVCNITLTIIVELDIIRQRFVIGSKQWSLVFQEVPLDAVIPAILLPPVTAT